MKRVKVFLDVGYPGLGKEEIFEFDDGATKEEIEEEVKHWVSDRIDWYWEVISAGESDEGDI